MYFWIKIISPLKRISAKISFIILIIVLLYACDSTKRVPNGENLLVHTELIVDGKTVKKEEVINLIGQKPNTQFLKLPFSLYVYNWASPNPDSLFAEKFIKDTLRFQRTSRLLSEKQVYRLGESFLVKGYSNFFKKVGEAPVIIDEDKIEYLFKEIIDYSINGNRLRTSFGKIVDAANSSGFYDYEEEYYEE